MQVLFASAAVVTKRSMHIRVGLMIGMNESLSLLYSISNLQPDQNPLHSLSVETRFAAALHRIVPIEREIG
jgi:hypothetical protein